MARTNNLTNFLTDVASAIKTKTGDSTAIPASQFDTKIANISTGHLDNTEYNTAIDDLDDILQGSTPTTIYPPNWSEIGYTQTPQDILDDFNYAKEIYDNWDVTTNTMYQLFKNDTDLVYMPKINISNVTNMREAFSGCSNLVNIPLLNTSNVTNMRNTFGYCSRLKTIPQIDTSEVTEARQLFASCSELVNVPVLDMSSATNMSGMFNGCASLSNDSLNNVMEMCIGATSFTGTKTLAYLSISSAQATICQSLSNYQAFLNAGWTTGY